MKISIVTPSFNQVHYIKKCLTSIQTQTHNSFEHIIYEHGSTDGTLEILKNYKKKFSSVTLRIGLDSGHVDALNKGIQEITGDIFGILNTDDNYADQNVFSDIVEVFDKNPDIDIVYARGIFLNSKGKQIKNAYVHSDCRNLKLKMINSIGILHPATFIRKDLIRKAGLFSENMSYSFDYEYWLKLIFSGANFFFLDRVIAYASIHDNAKTMSSRGISLDECADAAKKYYGYVAVEWIERKANYTINNADGIINYSTQGKDKEILEETKKLFLEMNTSKKSYERIIHYGLAAGGLKTSKLLMDMIFKSATIFVSASDMQYFNQALTLISGIHKNEDLKHPIFIFDLGMRNDQKTFLRSISGVYVIEFPRYYCCFPNWYFKPKSYVYKIFAMHHILSIASLNTNVIWIDAGVYLNNRIKMITDLIDINGHFFVNHDDRPNWPIFNISATSDECIKNMNTTRNEVLAGHLCSCLMGVKAGGKFSKLFKDAFKFSLDQKISLGDKHPEFPIKKNPSSREVLMNFHKKEISKSDTTWDLIKYRKIFGYFGHRQDQSIISILAARYSAVISSAQQYCIATERSSCASKKNWDSGGFSDEVEERHEGINEFQPCVTIHHRGTYLGFESIIFQEKQNSAVVLGNGPSLKPYDFHKDFKKFDTFGMNAAYRYWEKIEWWPTYYSCLDEVVGFSHKEAILELIKNRKELGIENFLLRNNLIVWLGKQIELNSVWNFDSLGKGFPEFNVEPVTTGSHTCVWASILGYKKIFILGVDCNYVEKINNVKVSTGTNLIYSGDHTLNDNPNYFFNDYQKNGDEFNLPNPHKDLHLRSWRNVATILKVKRPFLDIKNSSMSSRMDAFPLQPLFSSNSRILLGPFKSGDLARYDETDCIAKLYLSVLKGSVMIDVGAHFGSSLALFLDRDWKVFAFEPDEKNRKKLLKFLSKHRNSSLVKLDDRAVSNKSCKDITFYCSEESTGVSGLSAFLPTHKAKQIVDTTTLSEALGPEKIQAIDFLKIDTEGYDLFVLQGFPWERFKPAVIECEFEDTKTVPLGYTFHDLAKFLLEKGYQVYVSEWHPIVRYGIRHNWKCLLKYPCELTNEKAWGNLMAFRDQMDDAVVVDAVKKELKFYGVDGNISKETPGPQAELGDLELKCSDIVCSESVFLKNGSYKLEPPWGENWVAGKHKGNVKAGDTVAGKINFRVDADCKLKVTLCRDGSAPFESSVKKLSLSKGEHSVTLSHQFKENHQGVRIQIGVEDRKIRVSDIKSEIKPGGLKKSLPKGEKTWTPPARKEKAELANPESCLFLLGNGPSINDFDFRLLRNVKSLGMNAAYRYWGKTGVYPDYYICMDTVVTQSLKGEIYELIQNRVKNGIQLFFLRKNLLDFYPDLKNVPEAVFFEDYMNSPYFEGIAQGITTGSFAALLGAMLGYKKIYLLGIDLDYVSQIPEAEKVTGNVLEITRDPDKNPNYFFDDYQRKGDRFNVPESSPNLHYKSWLMAKKRLERFGAHVMNCNPKSKLDIFDYADINEIFPH